MNDDDCLVGTLNAFNIFFGLIGLKIDYKGVN